MRAAILVICLLMAGCFQAGDDVVLVVSASYPGANAQVVADTIATPIEQQIVGVERMVRIESESRSDGSYIAFVRFQPGTDPAMATVLVQNRIALAQPILPMDTGKLGLAVRVKPPAKADERVAIALVDQGHHGHDALRKLADAAAKKIAADGALAKVETFPGPDEDQLHFQIDRAKCAAHGLAARDAVAATQKVLKPDMKPREQLDELKKLTVKEIPLTELADIKLVKGPPVVYRVDLYPAIRVIGTPPEGKSPTAAAANCATLAEAERQRAGLGKVVVTNATVK